MDEKVNGCLAQAITLLVSVTLQFLWCALATWLAEKCLGVDFKWIHAAATYTMMVVVRMAVRKNAP